MTQTEFGRAIGYSGKSARDGAGKLETVAGDRNHRKPRYEAMIGIIGLAVKNEKPLWPGCYVSVSDPTARVPGSATAGTNGGYTVNSPEAATVGNAIDRLDPSLHSGAALAALAAIRAYEKDSENPQGADVDRSGHGRHS